MTKKRNNYGHKKIQEQINLIAYNKVLAFENFRYLLEALEEYVEKLGYYPDFKDKRQLRNITIPKEKNYSLNNCEELFRTKLLLFVGVLGSDTPDETKKEIQEEFYKWISVVGIDANNCPDEKLRHFLLEINNVLEGNSERFIKQVGEYIKNKEENQPVTVEDAKKALTLFNSIQIPIDDKEKQAELYKDKNYFEVGFENKFDRGDIRQGRQMFSQITNTVASHHDDFHFFPQKVRNPNYNPLTDDPSEEFLSSNLQVGGSSLDNHQTNIDEVVQDIKTKPQDWTVDEILTELNNFGWAKKKEHGVYCRHARLNDYDQQGKLNFHNNQIYLWENFNSLQRFEIKQAKNISGDYLTNEEIKWVVREVKENPRVWRIEAIKGQTYLIHSSAQIKDDEVGTLIHNRQKFNETEWVEINQVFERAILIDEIKQNAKLERLFVLNRETGEVSENEDWFIHNQLKKEFDNKTGYLVYVPNLMVRAKDLTEAEQKELNYNKLETSQQVQSQNRSSGGKGGLGNIITWGSLTVVSLIGLAFTKNTKK